MTRIAIDAATALRIVADGVVVAEGHALVAPKVLQSHALSALYREVRRGERTAQEAKDLLEGLAALKVRLLGDRVSRAVAWQVAESLGWEDTSAAEYVAVARLQADVLVTVDEALARAVEGVVPTAAFTTLTTPA
ncbi:hypothetical protein [Cellulomonas endophytica]|uniref:hypothetical protein n=1 Tax=Cellulomonas endophytica TaxID=2494735 RepID=UPI0010132AD5|nr:hypothetical protein [Cellulomonas endophytica]